VSVERVDNCLKCGWQLRGKTQVCVNPACTSSVISTPITPPAAAPAPALPSMQGWTCPRCCGGLSPYTSRCPCVPLPLGFTYTGG
jgi:hypothetical protein